MFAIAFDMVVAEIRHHYPKGISAAYSDIGKTVGPFGFERIQGSVYLGNSHDITKLFDALNALKALGWFPKCARDVRGFRVENWSDFTASIKKR